MSKNNSCYWSKSRYCKKVLFGDMEDIFIIGSCDQDRKEYIETIGKIIEGVGLNPVFAEDLKENNNYDAFCDNICSHIIGSRLIINDISAPLKEICQKCEKNDYIPSLNVYWEYGYAAGLGKPQIVICEQEQFDKIPFDVAGKQIQPYTKETLEQVLIPLINSELENPIPKSRFQVFTSNSERKDISIQEVEKVKKELIEKISHNDLTLIFTFYPRFEENGLFLFGRETIKFLESNLPIRIDEIQPVFNYFSSFSLHPMNISHISDIRNFGNNILINKDGIIVYGIYVNGDENLVEGVIKMFPFYEILNSFLGVLDYIEKIFESIGYNEKINLSMDVENIHTYRYVVGDKLDMINAVHNEKIGKFNASGINPIKREIDLLELKNPEYKIEISKNFFNPILRGFGKIDSNKYNDFLKLMQE